MRRDDWGNGRQRVRAKQVNATPAAPPAPDPVVMDKTEMDRLLDKIGATGIESLSSDERALLDKISRRRRDLH